MSGPLIGEAGADHLLTALSSTLAPLQFIEEFQQNNGILPSNAPTSLPVMKVLDLHGLSRVDVSMRILQELRKKMVERAEQLPLKSLEALLEQTFPYIGFEELRAVPLAIMKRMPEVPARFLKKLSINPALYKDCSVEIKRQIWLIDESLFRDKVFPLLNQHIGETLEFASENPLPPTKRRESDVVLQELVHLVGKSVALYNMLLHFFRTLLVSTHNAGFCALRADLLMALHDVGVSEIYHLDPCHKFAWCLDACVRDGAVELRRIKEMQFYFSSVPPSDPILGDLAMIVANPHATNTLIRSIFTTLVDVVNRESIPKDDDALVYMSDLLTLGLNAEEMIRDQAFQTIKAEKEILQNFYPLLAFRILDDAARTPDAGTDLRVSTQTHARPLPPAEPLDDTLIALMQRHALARRVMMYYVLTRVAAHDAPSVELLLATITRPTTTPQGATTPALVVPADEPAFVQSLVSYVIAVRDPRVTHVVIDTFLLAHKADAAHIHKQLARFLVESQTKLNPRDLMLYISKILGNNTSTSLVPALSAHLAIVAPLYRSLIDHSFTNKDVNSRLTEKTVPLLYQYLAIT